MDPIIEALSKLPKLLGRAGNDTDDKLDSLEKYGDADRVKIDRYFNYWRSKIREASDCRRTLSNGWSFSTLSGLSSFETHIHREPDLYELYYSRTGAIGSTIDAISEKMERRLGGIILYGYGNLFRESYFIEHAKQSGLLSGQRVYLVDCSLFYHVFAKSSLNPLLFHINKKQIKPKLLDFLDDPNSLDSLNFLRNDLNPTVPVMHFFLGNTFCNSEAGILKALLEKVAMPGDVVVAEYASYSDEFFKPNPHSYVNEMAKTAVTELFSVSDDMVSAEEIVQGKRSILTQIDFKERNTNKQIRFCSMLRRKFDRTELTSGEYELISSESVLQGDIQLDAFYRLSS